MAGQLSRTELIALVDQIADPRMGDDELAKLCEEFEANVPHPSPCDLIFYPCGGKQLSASEVVEIVLAHQPVILPAV